MIGKTISHYKITEKLGMGGMGVVYKAQDLKLDRFVALKFLPPHLTTSEEQKQRFIHEAKAASILQHNNICTIHEIDETEDGQLFICMDYYEGEILDKKIKEKPLLIEEAIEIAIQIAQGLTKAHEKKIVHRDIKPANITLTADGVVKILDFGLAKLSSQTKLTKESTTLGTVSYMSPEQAKGEDVDYRTDIWSLGVILYEMLTGQLPFKGDYESAVIYSIVNDSLEPVTSLRNGVPMELEWIINKCLHKNPVERYQHVDEMIVDLRQIKEKSELKVSQSRKGMVVDSSKKSNKIIKFSVILLSIVVILVAGNFFIDKIIQTEESDSKTTVETHWENSIAVLPFADLSPNKDQEYFCDGMTEQILTNLSKLNKLKVTARTSVNKYRNTEKTIPEIGEELEVKNILEGSVFKYGNSVRITAQLVNTKDGSHIWAENYDRDLENLFAILDDVSKSIAENLLKKLSVNKVEDIQTQRPRNVEAYEFYLKGNYFFNKFFSGQLKQEDFKTSEELYKKAIELDPNYVPAYAGLTDLYHIYQYYTAQTEEEKQYFLKLQEEYINAAYNLDRNSADVNRVMHWVYEAKNEIEKAYRCIKKSIEINPNNAESNRAFGVFLRTRGLPHLSIEYLDRAIELDPISTMSYISRALTFMLMVKFIEAENDLQEALKIDQSSLFAHCSYVMVLLWQEKYKRAEESLTKINEKGHPYYQYCKALLYAVNGEKEQAIKISHETNIYFDWFASAFINLILGMNKEFFQKFTEVSEELLKSESSWYLFLNMHPFLDNIRSDPRFQEILAKHKELYEENLAKYGDIEELLN
jgi:serine/threonine protein kinase/Tfp pilus assembly protein PilF